MKRIAVILFIAIGLAVVVMAQGGARGPLEGVWKVSEVVVTGANASNTPNAQPGLFIFTRSHFSVTRVIGAQPRAQFKAETPTNEEKVAAYDTLGAASGTYEVTGTTVTVRPVVARSPNYMAGGFTTYQFRIDGKTLWLTSKSTDFSFRLGDRVVPSSGPVSETRLTLIRVE